MSNRDNLIKTILIDNVSYEEACRIADNIINDGWAPKSVVEDARAGGFDEASKILVEMHQQFRRDNLDLLDEDFDAEKIQAVERDMRVGGVTTYSNLQAYLASRWHELMAQNVQEMLLPAKRVEKRRKRS